MSATDEQIFRNDSSRKRSVIGLAIFGAIAVLASGKLGLVVVVFFAFVAYRNWTAGLFVNDDHVTIRNIFVSHRIPISTFSRAAFLAGSRLNAGWGYINVETTAGNIYQVTVLRRSPSDGSELSGSINACVERRKH
jgi:hypothetical protein